MKLLLAFLILILAGPASAQEKTIAIGFVTQARDPVQPVSPLDREVQDEGIAGARLGMSDNMSTGRFTGQFFTLVERTLVKDAKPEDAIRDLAREGIRFVVTDLDAPLLTALASAPEARDTLILNARAPDDALRNEACRANLLHTIPSRAMLADALAQYLMAKRWRRWFLVIGSAPSDELQAEAFRRAATRFGAEIVGEKDWTFKPGHARTDTGHVTLQSEIPALTQGTDHDVLVVSDETNEFGDYLSYRTARPRLVAGTHGLVSTGWSAVSEQWGQRSSKTGSRKCRAAE